MYIRAIYKGYIGIMKDGRETVRSQLALRWNRTRKLYFDLNDNRICLYSMISNKVKFITMQAEG